MAAQPQNRLIHCAILPFAVCAKDASMQPRYIFESATDTEGSLRISCWPPELGRNRQQPENDKEAVLSYHLVVKPPAVPLEKIRALEPVCLRLTIPDDYRDENGHMNMRWYLAIFDDAGEVLHERLGLTPEYHRAHRTGTVDLEHHVHYLSEVMPHDQIAVYVRCVSWSPKRLHYLMFMVNETRSRLASIFECINAFMDAAERKTVPFPPEIAQRIAGAVSASERLDWPPPLCGAMRP